MERGKKINNVALGAFIFAGIFLLFFFIYFAGKFSFLLGGGYSLSIEYDFVDNLQIGAKVRVSGGPAIGYIDKISFETGKIVIRALLEGKYRINRGANFYIYSTSLVGQKYINVSGYNPNAPEFYTNNEYIMGRSPIGFARTIELAGSAVNSLISSNNSDTINQVKETFQNTIELIAGLNRVIHDNEKDLRDSIHNLNMGLKNSAEVMNRVSATMLNLESFSKKINNSMDAFSENDMKDLVSNITILSYNLKVLSADINTLTYDKDSPLGLVRDKEMRTRLENTIKNFEDFSKTISDNPSKLLFGGKEQPKKTDKK